jgi:hypothetical protein
MSRRLVSSLTGVGSLYAGGQLLRTTPYEVSLWSDDQVPVAPGVEAVTAIDGHIDITGMGEMAVLAGPDELTLELQDRRRLVIRLTSSGGAFEAKGWLPSH